MAHIRNFIICRHIRSERSNHILLYKNGHMTQSGRGLSMWFLPLSASIAEIPVDDCELAFMFHGRSKDFQDVSAQGTITYRSACPETLSERVDFSIDLSGGHYLKQPLEHIAAMLTVMSQQLAWAYIAQAPIQDILTEGQEQIRLRIEHGLRVDDNLSAIGLEIVNVRVSAVKPSAELERALEVPVRENIQQRADEATFERRALAVEKERAIRENELQNEIELSRRKEKLIEQQGVNERRRMTEDGVAKRIQAEAQAVTVRLDAAARAESIRVMEEARVNSERERMTIYRETPPAIMAAVALRELSGKIQKIDHLNISPELLGPQLLRLVEAGTSKLEG